MSYCVSLGFNDTYSSLHSERMQVDSMVDTSFEIVSECMHPTKKRRYMPSSKSNESVKSVSMEIVPMKFNGKCLVWHRWVRPVGMLLSFLDTLKYAKANRSADSIVLKWIYVKQFRGSLQTPDGSVNLIWNDNDDKYGYTFRSLQTIM
jgi:hypothetical protein